MNKDDKMDHCTTQEEMFSRNIIVTINVPMFQKRPSPRQTWKNLRSKKHPSVRANITYMLETCLEEDRVIEALRKHRWSQHGIAKNRSKVVMDTLLEKTVVTELNKNPHFAIISSMTLGLRKSTQLISFRHAIIENLLLHQETRSSVQAFQKHSQSQPCFLLCSGKHRIWIVWILFWRRKQYRNGEV